MYIIHNQNQPGIEREKSRENIFTKDANEWPKMMLFDQSVTYWGHSEFNTYEITRYFTIRIFHWIGIVY